MNESSSKNTNICPFSRDKPPLKCNGRIQGGCGGVVRKREDSLRLNFDRDSFD